MLSSVSDPRLIFLCAWLVVSTLACDDSQKPPDVILVSIDTLRADALEVREDGWINMPRLAAFAEESYVFSKAYTQSPHTIVSHATMLTGLTPRTHGARADRPLSETHTTLAEALSELGYRTAGFTAHADWLSRKKGFAQGFDRFESKFRSAEANSESAIGWLDSWWTRFSRRRGAPIFLFIHYYDVHSDWREFPYESEPRFAGFYADKAVEDFVGCRDDVCASRLLQRANAEPEFLSSREVDWIRGLYEAGVATLDRDLGEFLDALDRRGLLDTSWVVITADHGEAFGEHGRMLHSQPYREAAQVPLVIRPPAGIERVDVEALVGLVDLVPTLLEILGAPAVREIEGESLVSLMAGGPASDRLLEFDFYHVLENFSVRSARFNLIFRGPDKDIELYDLASDPDEHENVARRFPRIVSEMLSTLADSRAQRIASLADPVARQEISQEEASRLRALGYIE